ncbi:MAG: hypothetical protein IH586_19925 [Anaerolineaceae bacterium]|nr:hypothetical protein [Anaerolineaceae bacterium]
MERAYYFLLVLFFVGLLLTAMLGAARTRRARLALLWICLAFVNSGALAILFAVYVVSRLDGSTPPGLAEILRPLIIPVILIGLIDIVIIILNQRVKLRTG